jgi:hypothetical protein
MRIAIRSDGNQQFAVNDLIDFKNIHADVAHVIVDVRGMQEVVGEESLMAKPLWPRRITKTWMPRAKYCFMMCQRIGLPPVSIIGFGLRCDSSLMHAPGPPAKIIAFNLLPSCSSEVPTQLYEAVVGQLDKPFSADAGPVGQAANARFMAIQRELAGNAPALCCTRNGCDGDSIAEAQKKTGDLRACF